MNQQLTIGKRPIGPGQPCFIIAEAGSNHNGQLDTALALIDSAAECGADAVKFQTFNVDQLVAPTRHPIARLSDQFGQFGQTVYDMFQKVQMPLEWLPQLYERATSRGLIFLSTPFDEASVDHLEQLGVPGFKVASYEIVHLPLLRYIASKQKPILLSTGMADLGEIEEALKVIHAEGNDQVALLHCAIGYPAAPEHVHLAAMETLRQAFGLPVGFSDHTLGIAVPLAAVARGASVIEKHFTLDARAQGPDHSFAAEPEILAQMIQGIREVERAIGSPEKRCQPSEELHYHRGRRAIFAAVDIPEGMLIAPEMLAILRPGVGLKPKFFDVLVGRRAKRAIRAFDPVSWDDV
ncbi:MAG: N-acetylneuraminate synthase family protein [Candidatus Omnitrophica bacterium]|nr:N-acetylneuraminate synthase family protein [Candidatus Omnitrophota bacterium]